MKKVMERIINELTDYKAEGDLIFSSSKSLKMSSQKGSISEYKVSSSQILGIRAIKDGKVGISYTEAMDNDSLSLLIKEALQNAEANEPNPLEKILEMDGYVEDEANYPEEDVDINFKTKKTLELESRVKELDTRVFAVPNNSYNENEYSSLYLSSRGRGASYKDKSYSIMTSALMDSEGKKSNFYDYHLAHVYKDLDWDKVVNTSLEHARNLLDEKSLKTGKYHVRFNEDCLKNLIECFSNFYSAKAAIDKVNPWATKIGEEVISKDLSIIDDPLFNKSFRITKFDSEGVERKTLKLIENGVLNSFYQNSVTANHFKTSTTGHASRGASSSLNVCGTHLLIRGKNIKPSPTRYIEIIQMDGLYSGANRVTGDFSIGIKGYLWENGERTMTFGNCTLSGNLMELLKNSEAVGEELLGSTDQSFFSVPLMFNNLSVAGT